MPSLFLAVLVFITPIFAAFGYTRSGSNYIIDAGSSNPLVFQVSASSCDINSILFRGAQLQASGQGTHIGSGLGSATVGVSQFTGSSGTNYIRVTCATPTLTHYMVVRQGDSTIHMATYISAEPSIGELRFIARLDSSRLPGEYPFGNASTTAGASAAIEGSDVFLVGGQTRSKFYSSARYIDRDAHCVYGGGADPTHVCVLTPQRESSSGGPFFRDIESNNAGAATNLYNYMNSGHVQTEAFRTGLHGPYLMQFSRSGIPTVRATDTSFWDELPGIQGYVPRSGRGAVRGTASGVASGIQPVVHWYNAAAQYWAAAGSGGVFASPPMKPGTYTMVLYQTEFRVATATVEVRAGQTATANVAGSLAGRNSLFKIGEYDGQPVGFRNAANQLRMHPSDGRMASWTGGYRVGDPLDNFPMAVFKSVNSPVAVTFSLASVPSGDATLRIATTLSFAGARPQPAINSWMGAAPAAPVKIDSRGVTRGAYRGFGEVYDFSVPASALVAGTNTLRISAISGSSGDAFLSPNFVSAPIEDEPCHPATDNIRSSTASSSSRRKTLQATNTTRDGGPLMMMSALRLR
jgi:rhamnogalacturonan endolyase